MLTDLSCKALISESKRINKPIKKSDGKGLLLHAFPNGSAYWYHKYSYYGKHRQIAYGQYPIISLADARTKHAASYLLLTDGIDPYAVRQEKAEQERLRIEQQELASLRTFKALAETWHTRNLKKWSPAHAANIMRRLNKNLFPDLGTQTIDQISRKQLLSVLRKVEQRSPSDARRCAQYSVYIFNDAIDEEYIDTNIALGIAKSLAPQVHGHFASMDITELPNFLRDLDNNTGHLSKDRLDAIWLLMLTVVRPNEVIKAEWSEFDFDKRLWIIPKKRMKMRNDHIVPLSKQAIEILQKRWKDNIASDSPYPQSKYVFPSRKKPQQPMSHNTVCKIIIDMGWKGRHTGHGFRALFMGIAKEELKYRHEVPDRQLAHKPKGNVNRAYDRAQFLDERAILMQQYADYIAAKSI